MKDINNINNISNNNNIVQLPSLSRVKAAQTHLKYMGRNVGHASSLYIVIYRYIYYIDINLHEYIYIYTHIYTIVIVIYIPIVIDNSNSYTHIYIYTLYIYTHYIYTHTIYIYICSQFPGYISLWGSAIWEWPEGETPGRGALRSTRRPRALPTPAIGLDGWPATTNSMVHLKLFNIYIYIYNIYI